VVPVSRPLTVPFDPTVTVDLPDQALRSLLIWVASLTESTQQWTQLQALGDLLFQADQAAGHHTAVGLQEQAAQTLDSLVQEITRVDGPVELVLPLPDAGALAVLLDGAWNTTMAGLRDRVQRRAAS
jgi:hypothetical protein